MVLRCKGLSPDLLDSALNRVAQELADSSLYSVNNNDPARKATSNKRANQMVTFTLIIHSYSYVNGVELFVKQIDGVERVKGGHNSINLEVTGKVDPFKVQELVECETKKKVELIFPSAQIERNRVGNQVSEEKLKKRKKVIYGNDIANKKTEESISVLKIKLCCDSCNQKVKNTLQNRGLETVTMDVEKDLVTVKGAIDMTEFRSYIKDKLKKDVEILFPAEVVFPSKKENCTAYTKDRDDGDTNDKDKDSTTAFDKKNRGTITVAEKYKGTAAVVSKHKGIAAADEKDKDWAAMMDKKYRGTITADEKFKATAVIEKNKGVARVDEKYTGCTAIDRKVKGTNTTVGKYGDKDEKKEKDKDDGSTDETIKGDGRRTKYQAFEVGVLNERGGGRKKNENAGKRKNVNTKISYGYDDHKHDYWREWCTVENSNGLDQIFSDENPHSCCIL